MKEETKNRLETAALWTAFAIGFGLVCAGLVMQFGLPIAMMVVGIAIMGLASLA